MGVENYIFESEIRSGVEEPGGTPPPRIPRSSTPPPPPAPRIIIKYWIKNKLINLIIHI